MTKRLRRIHTLGTPVHQDVQHARRPCYGCTHPEYEHRPGCLHVFCKCESWRPPVRRLHDWELR
jgi:hypothetical protein